MISPFASRLWLATEITTLVRASGSTAAEIARRAELDPRKLSYLLKGERRPNANDLARILKHLPVPDGRGPFLLEVARAAEQNGWWEKFSIEMGPRQATYADLETGAVICEFSQALIPGLLQTEQYTTARATADRSYHSKRFLVKRAVEARALRQEILTGRTALGYEAILDKAIIRRAAVPVTIMRDQINHIIGTAMQNPKVSVHLLLLGATLPGNALPATSFSIYRYRDLDDLELVAVETDETDVIVTDPAKVATYRSRYESLRTAALGLPETLEALTVEADRLPLSTRETA